MTKGNSTSVITVRLPDPVVARVKTIARRKRVTVNELLKNLVFRYVAEEYFSEEQVIEMCESFPLAWKGRIEGEEPEFEKEGAEYKYSLAPVKAEKFVIGNNKVGRNDPCPCGSGKKYKKCHGV